MGRGGPAASAALGARTDIAASGRAADSAGASLAGRIETASTGWAFSFAGSIATAAGRMFGAFTGRGGSQATASVAARTNVATAAPATGSASTTLLGRMLAAFFGRKPPPVGPAPEANPAHFSVPVDLVTFAAPVDEVEEQ